MEQQGYYTNSIVDNSIFNSKYKVALYLRFSKDDGKASDNSSIVTQQMMLEGYCSDNGYTIYDTYKDDGYTGLNYDRPAFQRMLFDIESGKVNLVITKDLSRLGRDYIQTGYYTEIYFTERNVRYIAVNDGVDTIKADNDIAPFRNILNDMYSKDISRKVKSAKRQRALKGFFINPNAPYGYKKNPENKNQLIVDSEAAEVVKEIFKLALNGRGRESIAKTLTKRQILCPSAYKTAQGIKGFVHCKSGDYKWKYTTILAILKDSVYVGDMVNHKYECTHYKAKKLKAVPKENHIVVKNTHEPLVSREDFERVQSLISARHTPRKHNHENLFRGLLFCAECKNRLTLSNQHIKSKGGKIVLKSFYRCMNHYQNPDKCTHYNYIYYENLFARVLQAVQKTIEVITSDEGILQAVQNRLEKNSQHDKLLLEKSKSEKRLTTLTTIVKKLYEDYALELLDLDNYRTMLEGYQSEQKHLKQHLSTLEEQLSKQDSLEEGYNKLKQFAKTYASCKTLTSELLKTLIDRIEIHHPIPTESGKRNERTQHINIIYRFIRSSL